MNKIAIAVVSALMTCISGFSAQAQEKVLRLTSLEWPPYAGPSLAQQGESVAVLRAAAEAMGYELEVKFLPWTRAVAAAKEGTEYVGYFPEYFSSSLEEDFLFSSEIGKSPLGLMFRKDNPIAFSQLSDLSGVKIGVVQDYVNTEEFDRLVAEGVLSVETVTGDVNNVQKVLGKRIPTAIIDQNVLGELLASNDAVKGKADELEFKLLEEKGLFVMFNKNEAGQKMRDVLNEGLTKIDIDQVIAASKQ